MLVETILQDHPVRALAADVVRMDPGSVLELEAREVDVLDLDLARPDVGDASVVSHDFPP